MECRLPDLPDQGLLLDVRQELLHRRAQADEVVPELGIAVQLGDLVGGAERLTAAMNSEVVDLDCSAKRSVR